MYDLIIIGAGPAGLTAGIYARRANLKTLILEKESIGGQIASSSLVENYPGFSEISGAELSNNFFNQVINLGCDFEIEEVKEIINGKIKKVITDMGEYSAKSIIIATGAHHRLLGLENEIDLIGKGVHFCASCDGAFYKDKEVAVIGGGNSAVGNAIYLSGICKKVFLIVREEELMCEKTLVQRVNAIKNIEIWYTSEVSKLNGEELEEIVVNKNGKNTKLKVQGMFISIGQKPNTSIFKDLIKIDKYGYIDSNDCSIDVDGIFVAGDCRSKKVRQLTTAVNDGTIAATMAIDYVGEQHD